nr:lamin tail domain-containing protein [Pyxidicoccus trucidator]
MAYQLRTTGTQTPSNNLRLRVPTGIASERDLVDTCEVTVQAGAVWRFTTQSQVSVFDPNQLTISNCPAPKLLVARALSTTEVRLTFDRRIATASVQATDFTIATLTVTGATVNGSQVTLTTSEQTASTEYTVTVSGEVTDLAGKPINDTADTAVFFGVTPPPAGAALVINEVDYDTVGTDNAEYIEIYNRGGAAADLTDVVLVLVNGDAAAAQPRREYLKFPLSAVTDAAGTATTSLPAGGYIIAASTTYFTATPPPAGVLRLVIGAGATGTGQTDIIQNGSGDGVGLVQNTTGTLIDSVFYEPGAQNPQFTIATGAGDRLLNFLEGTRTSASDSNTVAGSLQRVPNGGDTNNNDYDFAFLPSTPGTGAP